MKEVWPAGAPFANSDRQRGNGEEETGAPFVDDLSAHHEVELPRGPGPEASEFTACVARAAAAFGLKTQLPMPEVFRDFAGAAHQGHKGSFMAGCDGGLAIPGLGEPAQVVRPKRAPGSVSADDGAAGPGSRRERLSRRHLRCR